MTQECSAYTPPKVWTWDAESGGRFAKINRPIAGATHDKELPVGEHPLQIYSLATPNGVKVTVLLEELLGSKLRALYQRRQGRDLFDLWYAFSEKNVHADKVIECFHYFMGQSDAAVSRREFEDNLEHKMQDKTFITDTRGLLPPDYPYDPWIAFKVVMNQLISRLD